MLWCARKPLRMFGYCQAWALVPDSLALLRIRKAQDERCCRTCKVARKGFAQTNDMQRDYLYPHGMQSLACSWSAHLYEQLDHDLE